MNYQKIAEDFARTKIPELKRVVAFGAPSRANKETIYDYDAPQLHHWLQLFEMTTKPDALLTLDIEGNLFGYHSTPDGEMNELIMQFDFTTGQPATGADWKALCEVLGLV